MRWEHSGFANGFANGFAQIPNAHTKSGKQAYWQPFLRSSPPKTRVNAKNTTTPLLGIGEASLGFVDIARKLQNAARLICALLGAISNLVRAQIKQRAAQKQ